MDTPSAPTPPTRTFASMAAAENAYREQVTLNQSLSTKFDELGSKIDALTNVLTQLVSKIDILGTNAPPTETPPSIEPRRDQSELPVLPFRSGDARNYEPRTVRSPTPPTGL